MNGPPVRVRSLSAGYGRRSSRAVPVLRDVELTLPPGSVTGLVGRNAAGKTTLLRLILGVHRPWSGRIDVDGMAPASYRRRRGVGYLAETPSLPRGWTAEDLLRYGCHLSGVAYRPGRSGAAEDLGLTDALGRRVETLSKGTARRVALAWAMTGDPALLVLDEPTEGLDPPARAALRAVVREAGHRGATVVVSSHELDEVVRICASAHVVAAGTVSDPFVGDTLQAELLEAAVRGPPTSRPP